MIHDKQELDAHRPLYRVTEVAGRPPMGLDDLIGATTVTVENGGHEYSLIGTGVKVERIVLFHQMEADSTLDTGPIWTMTDQGTDGLAAQPPEPH